METNGKSTDKLVAPEVIAALVDVKPVTVLRWWRAGRIPGLKIGKRTVRFDQAEVMKVIRRGT